MRAISRAAAAIALSLISTPTWAAQIFSDTFDADSLGLNHTSFVNGWTVTNGTVDVIGTGFFDVQPGNGNYIDLDGSTADAGIFAKSLTLTGGISYTVSFDLAGSARGDANFVDVSFGTSLATFLLNSSDPFATHILAFTPGADGNYTLSFANAGGDNLGAILDDVVVNSGSSGAVPEPSTWALMLVGFGAVGFVLRRRRQTEPTFRRAA